MTATNDTYRASVNAAEATKVNSQAAAVSAHLSSITAARNDVGYREGFPTGFATYDALVRAANAAKLQALADAERVKQGAVEAARDLSRAAGERPT